MVAYVCYEVTGVCDRCGQKEVSRGPGLHPVTAVGLHGPDWEGHQSHHYATLNSSDEPNRAESFCSFYPDMQQLGYTHRASLKHPRARASSQPWPAWPAWSLASSTGVAKSTGVPRRSRSTPLSTPLSSTAMTMNDEARDGGWLCVMDGLGGAGGAACCGGAISFFCSRRPSSLGHCRSQPATGARGVGAGGRGRRRSSRRNLSRRPCAVLTQALVAAQRCVLTALRRKNKYTPLCSNHSSNTSGRRQGANNPRHARVMKAISVAIRPNKQGVGEDELIARSIWLLPRHRPHPQAILEPHLDRASRSATSRCL